MDNKIIEHNSNDLFWDLRIISRSIDIIWSIKIYCNICCQCITTVSIILMNLILDNTYGFFYILDKNSIEFLPYIDCTGITPIWNDMCLVDNLYHKLYNYGSKIFLVLMTRRENNFGYCWCDTMIVWSTLLHYHSS